MLTIPLKLASVAGLIFISIGLRWLYFDQNRSLAKPLQEERLTKLAHPNRTHTQNNFSITVDQIVAPGFTRPVLVTHAGDGSGRLFVVEQNGTIRIIKNSAVLPTAFLDINNLVKSPSDGPGNNERGLLGLAFHPNYETNGFFFVNYTNNNGDTVIARYTVSANPDVANPGSVVIILTIDQPHSNHNGGQLLFGMDGYVYIGMGDGGSGEDPDGNGQDKNTLLGAMLRIDIDNQAAGKNYAIPPGNPYAIGPGADEIWAIGLRNPWRFSFDRQNGDLYLGDVGQYDWEEISYQAAGTPGGLNFGWSCKEGNHVPSYAPNNCPGPFVDPIAEYDHGQGISVTGGFVYRGTLYPNMYGYYFFADYGSGKIWSMRKTGSNPDTWSVPELELDTNFRISAFGEDESGELYVVDFSGKIRHLADTAGPSPSPEPTIFLPLISTK